MTQKQRERLAVLATACDSYLADPSRQSVNIWRGDMRAIVAAARQLGKAEAERAKNKATR